jgi:hypothetical protein
MASRILASPGFQPRPVAPQERDLSEAPHRFQLAASPEVVMTVAQYLKQLEHPQKEQIQRLDKIIRTIRPKIKPRLWNSHVGYGVYDYTYRTGRTGSWFLVGWSARKSYISLAAMANRDGAYLTDAYRERLGKVQIGKSCINIKNLDDVNQAELKKFLREAFTVMIANCKNNGWPVRLT